MNLKNTVNKTDTKLLENMGVLANILFQSGYIVVDSEWVDFSVEAILKQKVRQIQVDEGVAKRIERTYVIHCYRDEPMFGERKILATSSGSSPIMAFESLSYQYAQPIMERLRRQYQHLFSS